MPNALIHSALRSMKEEVRLIILSFFLSVFNQRNALELLQLGRYVS
jgi:hypothetical protein